MNIDAQRIRERRGNVDAAGFFWAQPLTTRLKIRNIINGCLLVPLGISWFLWFIASDKPKAWATISFDVTIVVGVCLTLIVLTYTPWVDRRLYEVAGLKFYSDDLIEIMVRPRFSWALPSRCYSWTPLKSAVSEVTNIEPTTIKNNSGGHWEFDGGFWADSYWAYGVRVYFRDGRSFPVAYCVSEDEARIIATQLNQALDEIREAGWR